MLTMARIAEIEIATKECRNLYFAPIQRRIRGRFDFRDVAEKESGKFVKDWPAIPGQRLHLNFDTGEAAIVEPLRDAENESLRMRLETSFARRTPIAREEFKGIDTATWAYWMRRAIDAGHAKLVAGKLPEGEIPGAKREWSDKKPDPIQSLAEAIKEQSSMIAQLLQAVVAKK